MFQEINLSDRASRQTLVDAWENNNYTQVQIALQPFVTKQKAAVASVFNDITNAVYELENNSDPTWKADRIQVASSAPSGLANGEVYFELI